MLVLDDCDWVADRCAGDSLSGIWLADIVPVRVMVLKSTEWSVTVTGQ